jgi:hypothetical protein
VGAILAEIGGAIVGGVVVGAVLGVGSQLLLSVADLGMALLGVGVLATILGIGVGAGAGAALAGRLLGQAGSPWLAVLGGVLGGTGVTYALGYLYLGIDLFLLPVVAAPLAVGGAVGGYNLRRRPAARGRGGRHEGFSTR